MRRPICLVLVCALVASSAIAPSLHVHEYVSHDHPEHHHGPATHNHDRSPLSGPNHHRLAKNGHDQAIEAESCSAGRHAVSFGISCARVEQAHVDMAERPVAAIAAPIAPFPTAVTFTDVRVHGPPFEARIPSRAPPVIHA